MPSLKPNFEDLVDRYYEGLYRFGLSLTRSEDEAGDLVQQTFAIWAEKGHTLKDPRKAKSWLFTSLYREFLRVRRKNRFQTSQDESQLEFLAEPVNPDVLRRIDARLLMETLEKLDDVYREPLVLFYVEDLAYREIAEILDLPLGTVMSRLSRGKSQLKVLFNEGLMK